MHIVKCRISSEVEGKDKVLSVKWDFLAKYASRRKAAKDIGTDVKKGD
jgi:hypothetical protein